MDRPVSICLPTVEELEALLGSGRATCLGEGCRRRCFAIPGRSLCVKVYRSPDDPFVLGRRNIRREILRNRFSERGNTSCQEWRYYQELKARLPPGLMAVFPSTLERVLLPSFGWSLVEELISNADGSQSVTVENEFRRRPAKDGSEFLRAACPSIRALGEDLARHAVRFYDLPNIIVQFAADGTFRLRIADFEPVSRTFISLDSLGSFFVSLKVRRRFARYMKRLAEWVPQG